MKPNILQTLLSGRKKREMVMEEEVIDNKVDTIMPDKDMEDRPRLLEIIGDHCYFQEEIFDRTKSKCLNLIVHIWRCLYFLTYVLLHLKFHV